MSVRAQRTPSRRGRPRGRPPRRPRGHTTSSRQTARENDAQPSITSDSDSDAPTAQLTSDVDQGATQVNPHYGLRRNRVPQYRVPESMWNLWVPRLHLCYGSEQTAHYPTWTCESSGGSKASTFYPQW